MILSSTSPRGKQASSATTTVLEHPPNKPFKPKFVLKKGFRVYYPCFRSCSQIYAGRIASRAQAPGISRQLLSASITMRADLAREAFLFLIVGRINKKWIGTESSILQGGITIPGGQSSPWNQGNSRLTSPIPYPHHFKPKI